ncbi:alpha/beta fold hydrolase [Aquirhabdus sp.]|uniref:alpha/beta fold hydrolase n=1 Tax=Aquirhabdus sp. TaxID=2824160 RepID=UPI00396CCB93
MDKVVQHIDTFPFYTEYNRGALKESPRVHWINGWKVEFLAFANEATRHLPPVVILGGAFQNFNSYKYCVEPLLETGSVILVDLPSLGSNDQVHNLVTGERSLDLDIGDLAQILGDWTNSVHLNKVSMMGMSLGSVIAANFAAAHPEKMSRLVLMGVMQQTRKSWRMLIQEACDLLHENRMVEFGQAMVLFLVNHARMKETRMSPTARKLFFQQMSNFGLNERLRYEINANRLLRIKHVPSPSCQTLVATGQYDSFTLPHENAKFALSCPHMQFALIKNADHVPQLQKRRETLELFTTFLRGEPIDQLDGIMPMSREELQQMDRRGEERVKLVDSTCQMTHRTKADFNMTVNVVDLTYFGLLLEAGSEANAAAILAEPRDLSIHLPSVDSEGNVISERLSIECLIFEQVGTQVRALLKHGNFETSDRLSAMLASRAVIRD